MRYLMMSKKKIHFRVRMGSKNPSLAITACFHSASPMVAIGDPRDGFFDPTLTLMIDSYHIYPMIISSCAFISNPAYSSTFQHSSAAGTSSNSILHRNVNVMI